MTTTNKQEIIERLQKNSEKLQNLGVNQLGLFGSFVTGKVRDNSDVDVFVVFKPEQKTFRNFMNLSFFLEDLFKRQVDIVTPESLSQHFGSKILSEVEYVSFS